MINAHSGYNPFAYTRAQASSSQPPNLYACSILHNCIWNTSWSHIFELYPRDVHVYQGVIYYAFQWEQWFKYYQIMRNNNQNDEKFQ